MIKVLTMAIGVIFSRYSEVQPWIGIVSDIGYEELQWTKMQGMCKVNCELMQGKTKGKCCKDVSGKMVMQKCLEHWLPGKNKSICQ